MWKQTKDGDKRALELFLRHYSAKKDRKVALFVGPGQKMVLVTEAYDALFVWRKFINDAGEAGVNCAVFRNESAHLASDMIREAETFARSRWPGERLYTYVAPDKVRSTNAGYCFKKAGWKVCGETKKGLLVLEKI